jgi:hypothetical protein
MQLIEFAPSRAVRFCDIEQRPGHTLRGGNVIRALEDRYSFIQSPRTVEEADPEKGLLFRGGMFGDLNIDRLHFYNNGLLVEAKASTESCVSVIDDVVSWLREEPGLVLTPNDSMPRVFLSQVVVTTEASLARQLAALNGLSADINGFLSGYGQASTPAEVAGITIYTEPGLRPEWQFRFERRMGHPFSENRFFSGAPLTTEDHLVLLERLELAIGS